MPLVILIHKVTFIIFKPVLAYIMAVITNYACEYKYCLTHRLQGFVFIIIFYSNKNICDALVWFNTKIVSNSGIDVKTRGICYKQGVNAREYAL